MALEAPSKPRRGPSGAASLTEISLRRAGRQKAGNAKAGDLTGELRSTSSSAIDHARSISAPLSFEAQVPADEAPKVPAPPAGRDDAPVTRTNHPAVSAPTDSAPAPSVAIPPPTEQRKTEIAQQAQLAPGKPRSDQALIEYWQSLRSGTGLPFTARLDENLVAASWPDTVMVSCVVDDSATPHITRLGGPSGAVEYSTMITEWILTCSREVARSGAVTLKEEGSFPGKLGFTRYRMLLLPFVSTSGKRDQILCHLSSSK